MIFRKEKQEYKPHTSTKYIHVTEGNCIKKLPVLYENRENCCGCSACFAICPLQAISMEPDEEGFQYPLVDDAKCIRCYKCMTVCTFKVDQRLKGFL